MSLNIKNEDVHAAVRRLAELLGTSQTSAVELAVRAKLDELDAERQHAARERRIRAAAAALQEEYAASEDDVDLWEVMDALYDPETGLPR
ncbi:MAG TPA: type II toxin-antitoxin system VapB family antitoxin [Microbacterium sp.]|nr:type II toxin-antitoxin system VapB family antitoxin [Microbacterium sp.]